MISLTNMLEAKYHGSFTLMDSINDPLINENLGKMYVPRLEIADSIFFKKDETVFENGTSPRKICFIYWNQYGKNTTDPNLSYIQIPKNMKGFLARISISRNNYTPEYLQMDYLVDISNIKYHIDSELASVNVENIGMSVVRTELLKFKNIELTDYAHIAFDSQVKEFILQFPKEEIFEMYFK